MTVTILVDMDGPLADFDAHFYELCVANGFGLDYEGPTFQRHRFATDHIVDRSQRRAARQMVNQDPTWFRELPVVPGAPEGLEELAGLADVWICTKPLEANPTCRDAKAAWLAEHFGERWLQRLILAPDKSMVVGDVLLDDAPKVEWLARAQWRPVIYEMPWNGHGSDWGALPHWSWGDDPKLLLDAAR